MLKFPTADTSILLVTSWRQKGGHKTTSNEGLEAAEDTGYSQELSFVGEVPGAKIEVTAYSTFSDPYSTANERGCVGGSAQTEHPILFSSFPSKSKLVISRFCLASAFRTFRA